MGLLAKAHVPTAPLGKEVTFCFFAFHIDKHTHIYI
jgi:hypothetical protein